MGRKNMNQYDWIWDSTMPVRLSVPDRMTTESADRMNGISNAIIWCSARRPPMNGYLLLLAQENSRAISGKNPSIAKTASRPTSVSATTYPGAAGMRATTAAAVETNMIGAAQNMGLSAPEGTIISLAISLRPSAINWNMPSILPA